METPQLKIKVVKERSHSKASERYLDVIFRYSTEEWHGAIPIEYRRTGTDLKEKNEIQQHLIECYEHCTPERRPMWLADQMPFWAGKPKATETKGFFDALSSFQWCCVQCDFPRNPNWARRTQELKEFSYTLATDLNRYCPKCQKSGTQLIMVPLPRGGISGYEVWSPKLRTRMLTVLKGYDVYEGKVVNKDSLLPDHKFPEIRWDENTRRESLENLTDAELRRDFQLMSNQRNLQKREVCRGCYQTGKRGYPFGIKFFHMGDENWPTDIPARGKAAEAGCHGCGWYDLEKWRQALMFTTRKTEDDD